MWLERCDQPCWSPDFPLTESRLTESHGSYSSRACAFTREEIALKYGAPSTGPVLAVSPAAAKGIEAAAPAAIPIHRLRDILESSFGISPRVASEFFSFFIRF